MHHRSYFHRGRVGIRISFWGCSSQCLWKGALNLGVRATAEVVSRAGTTSSGTTCSAVPATRPEQSWRSKRCASNRGHVADIVVLATGYRTEIPSFLEPIAGRLKVLNAPGGSQEIVVDKEFSARFDGPEKCRLYVQNGARLQRGIADTNLSLVPWRASQILNSIIGRVAYDCAPGTGVIEWSSVGFERAC